MVPSLFTAAYCTTPYNYNTLSEQLLAILMIILATEQAGAELMLQIVFKRCKIQISVQVKRTADVKNGEGIPTLSTRTHSSYNQGV
jgi:hypothetical protein